MKKSEFVKFYNKGFNKGDLDLIIDKDGDEKYVSISLRGREVVSIGYKLSDEGEVFDELVKLYKSFDFSFYLSFDSLKELQKFNKINENKEKSMLKEIVESTRELFEKEDYKAFFDKKLKKFGVKSPGELDKAEKKKFFNEIDKEWKGADEDD